ncbi:hypothetical protein KGY73_03135 [bacterium]|nr:hypothetical protein [bacterium]
MNLSFWVNNKEYKLKVKEYQKNSIHVWVGERKYNVEAEYLKPNVLLLNVEGKVYETMIHSNAVSHSVYVNGLRFDVQKKSLNQILGKQAGKTRKKDIKTSMPGKIVKVLMEEGTEVQEGQAVLILEAMKMQNEIKSPQAGRITKLGSRAGDSVEAGALLFTVE